MPKVIVYTSPLCQPCRATKRKLRQEGVPFEEVDLTEPQHADKLEFFKGFLGDPLKMPVVEVWNASGEITGRWQEFRPDHLGDLVAQHKEESNK